MKQLSICFSALILFFSGTEIQAQSHAIRTSSSSQRVYSHLDLLQLRADLDTLFVRLGSLSADPSLDWSQTLSSSTSPGTDLDLAGFSITNIGNLSANGTLSGDSLVITSDASIAGELTVDTLVVTDLISGQIHSIANHNSDSLSEGVANLYFSDARVLSAISDTVAYIMGLIESMENTSSATCPPDLGTNFVCGTSGVFYGGRTYCTVQIGNQCWFAENLQTPTYRDETPIAVLTDNAEWYNATYGARCAFNNNSFGESEKYGFLYNYHAVISNRGLCPPGWHVPSNQDFIDLENELGGSAVAGQKLKAKSDHPYAPWDGTNESGFTAFPGGWRSGGANPGQFMDATGNAYFWTRTLLPGGNVAYRRLISSQEGTFAYSGTATDVGMSVRCIQD